MLENFIRAGVLAQTKKMAQEYANASPFPHITIDNFLTDSLAKKLLEDFPHFDAEKAKSELGTPSLKYTRENLREISETYRQLDEIASSNEFLIWLSELTGIPNLLHDPEYIGGGTHENLPSQDLAPHIDFNMHPKTGLYRRLNFLLYLNPEWKMGWGGELELHEDPWKPRDQEKIVSILPAWNKLAIFSTSDRSWHGFESIQNPTGIKNFSRKSIAMYFYTKEAPSHGQCFHHSTIYCERHMPATIKPGAALSLKDYNEMIRLTARRDQLLQFLYERELRFSEVTNALTIKLKEQGNSSNTPEPQTHQSASSCAVRDYKNLMRAYEDRLNYLQDLLEKDYSKKQNYPTTFLYQDSSTLVVARGSSNEKPCIFSGDTITVEKFHPNLATRGKKFIVRLDAILPNSATHDQFTMCTLIKKCGTHYLLQHNDYTPSRLYLLTEESIFGIAQSRTDTFKKTIGFLSGQIRLTRKQKLAIALAPALLQWNMFVAFVTNKKTIGLRGLVYQLHKNINSRLGLRFF